MASVFTKISNGEIPCYKVAENENYLAFLDINPLTEGHTLVISKIEVDYLFDLDETTYMGLMKFTREVALAIKGVIPCKRICEVVLGFEIPHAHIHLIPTNSEIEVDFKRPKLKIESDNMRIIADKINQNYLKSN